MFNDNSSKKLLYWTGWILALFWNPALMYVLIKIGIKDPKTGQFANLKYWIEISSIFLFAYTTAIYCIIAFREFK